MPICEVVHCPTITLPNGHKQTKRAASVDGRTLTPCAAPVQGLLRLTSLQRLSLRVDTRQPMGANHKQGFIATVGDSLR